jgi:hypothetical protein
VQDINVYTFVVTQEARGDMPAFGRPPEEVGPVTRWPTHQGVGMAGRVVTQRDNVFHPRPQTAILLMHAVPGVPRRFLAIAPG